MESMRQIVIQEINEERYNRKHIDAKIRKELHDNPLIVDCMEYGVELVQRYIDTEHCYLDANGELVVFESKNHRIAQIKDLDIAELVEDILVGVAYSQAPELFVSVAAKTAARLQLSDKVEAVQTVAEILAELCHTDLFDINKDHQYASLMLVCKIPLSDSLRHFMDESQYLPPMVCEPLELTHNFSSGYLTHNDSLVLGSGKHHDGDLCLDVLNIMNKVALKLDTEFLSKVEEEPTFELETQEQESLWMNFKRQSYKFYKLMIQCGNKFHFTHKVDNRGRIYTQGYHINPQGPPFKKAMIELAKEELVEGVTV